MALSVRDAHGNSISIGKSITEMAVSGKGVGSKGCAEDLCTDVKRAI